MGGERAGNRGGAAAQCLLRSGLGSGILAPEGVVVATPESTRDAALEGLCSCGVPVRRCARTAGGASAAAGRADACVQDARAARAVVLACPCEALPVVGAWLLPGLRAGSVIVSMLAGVTELDVGALLRSGTEAPCTAQVLLAATVPLSRLGAFAEPAVREAKVLVEEAAVAAAGLAAAQRREEAAEVAGTLLDPAEGTDHACASSGASRLGGVRAAEAALALLAQLRHPSEGACKGACAQLLCDGAGSLSDGMLLAAANLAERSAALRRQLGSVAASLGVAPFLWEALSSTRVCGLGIAGSSSSLLAKTMHGAALLDAVALGSSMHSVRAGLRPTVATAWETIRNAAFQNDSEPADPRLALPIVPIIRITRDGGVYARPKLKSCPGRPSTKGLL